jgi:hypothetical protein
MSLERVDTENGRSRWRCTLCGLVTVPTKHPPERIHHACVATETPASGLIERGLHFGAALAQHVAAGLPKATEEQRHERLLICERCPTYDRASQICSDCGCNCNGRKEFLNKLNWADQACPRGHWPAIDNQQKGATHGME